eukprot:scaffold84364_cov60-Phaeocystis_antarctica.AAC.2
MRVGLSVGPYVHHQFPWPSGLRRWIKAPISQGAWVRIPPGTCARRGLLNEGFCFLFRERKNSNPWAGAWRPPTTPCRILSTLSNSHSFGGHRGGYSCEEPACAGHRTVPGYKTCLRTHRPSITEMDLAASAV